MPEKREKKGERFLIYGKRLRNREKKRIFYGKRLRNSRKEMNDNNTVLEECLATFGIDWRPESSLLLAFKNNVIER